MIGILILFLIQCVAIGVCSVFGWTDIHPDLVTIQMIGFTSILLIYIFAKKTNNKLMFGLLTMGYAARVGIMFIDIYGSSLFTILHSGDDTERFYIRSVEYYEGNYSHFTTYYPYIIKDIYEIFGKNRLIAQYVNILCWVGVVFVVLAACKLFHVKEKCVIFIMAYLALLPNYICISSILLRESIMIFLDTWGFYLCLKWMKKKLFISLIMAFVVTFPAIILHSASIGLWIGFALIYAFWDVGTQRFAFQAKTIFVLLLGIAAIILLNFSSYRNLIMAYLPTNLSIESITSKEFAAGDSDYLMNIQVNNGVELIFWTIIRMFFFVFSPLPGSTTSLKYIFAFIVDSVPTAVIIFLTIKDAYYNKKGKYVFAAYAVCLIVIGIFAWGVSNAGTAMRHRSLIVGVFAIAYCMANEKKLIPVKIVDETKASEE